MTIANGESTLEHTVNQNCYLSKVDITLDII